MQVYYSLDTLPWIENCAVTIGTFDGLHLGHLSLLNKLKESENNLVITFSNHPLEVFQEKTIKRLTTPNQKIELFLESGIKNLLIFHFDPLLAQVSFKNFLHTLFQKGMRKLLLGKGSTIGAKREGNEQTIPSFAKATGFSSFFFQKKTENGLVISTSKIKRSIQEGKMKEATRMLGRNYIVNIEMQQLQQLPKKGIFKALYKKKEIALKIEQSRIIFPKKGEVTFFPLDEGKNFEESRSSFQKTTPLMKKTDPK